MLILAVNQLVLLIRVYFLLSIEITYTIQDMAIGTPEEKRQVRAV